MSNATATKSRQWVNENSVAEFIPYSVHLDENTIKTTSGYYLQVIKIDGRAHESADPEDVINWKEQLNGLLKNIASPNISLWTNIIRREENTFPGGEFEEGSFAEQLNNKYKNHVGKNNMMVNELYLTVLYRPSGIPGVNLLQRFEKNVESIKRIQAEAIEGLHEVVNTVTSSLKHYGARVLGCYDRKGIKNSEVLEFLSYLINLEWIPRALPRKVLSEALPFDRPFFGEDAFEVRGVTESTVGAVLSIGEYPEGTEAGLMNAFLSAPFPLILSQSFNFLSKPVATELLGRTQRRMKNAGDFSKTQMEEIDDALDDLTSGRLVFGEHHLALTILAKDARSLKKNLSDAKAELVDCNMIVSREDWAIESAFWSMLPGNFKYRARPAPISSRNFAGFSSFHNYPTGRRTGNQWGPSVTLLKTTSGAPYYFNFHSELSAEKARKLAQLEAEKGAGSIQETKEEQKALGNTLIIGPSGSGKTVTQGFLMAQSKKFNPTQIIFDKDRGLEIYVRAEGGVYLPFKNGARTGCNPFQMEPSEDTYQLLEQIVKKCAGGSFTTVQDTDISNTVRGVMRLPKHLRRISACLDFMDPTDPEGVGARLAKWCGNGTLAWVFDNETDDIDFSNNTMFGFDVTDFLDNAEIRTPLIMYLFHRISQIIDGRRMMIFMDEFWKLLLDEYFEDFAQNGLKTIRKLNGLMVFGTQSAKDVLKSAIGYSIIEQCATMVFMPNPKADWDDYVKGFKLTEREYQLIKTDMAPGSHQFLIKHGHNSVIAKLDLAGFSDELAVISGTADNVELLERIMQQVGDDPKVWLPEFHKQRVAA
ncbi:VirB4 family type IV secretion/conjugal transfer ATPase [Salmonella enterica]|jgi:type IV secretion system protein VirB4|uniref:Type IV secretion system protein virB4 n=4 Tax=Enterobacterales TaxID=91347 RepID=A0A193PMS4_KLEPN|nr:MULTISPECIES: VirB4 family type IV secretion/conjugal transfer ATPase [Enterobacterales]EAB6474229.1 VirB4 family type IV secretion/conjugal transfer ATPase [Salmonella enterica subsp. enterica]EAB9041685.1 VirB4 family type IV secretion/conjugal transfer ATPase [Salmonella enterica subsp. enterica serovar Dublin]EBH9883591.1 VirB4 family type IV secretion/conjugal transfer ATPase [Salmonella enterica subsp. enterica serovar Kisarawe]EBV6953087.1 VirB4 family type IV secretion/conjugal trans